MRITVINDKIKLGISACLLGEKVRYDAQHKRDAFLVDTLGKFVEYVPVCPEVECGLSTPREAMRLVGSPNAPKLLTQKTKQDITTQMQQWAETKIKILKKENLCGFVFKSRSPSSGMRRVKVYNEKGGIVGQSSGIFANMFMKECPLIPAEDEGRLHDPVLRENFIEQIFTLKRYREAVDESKTLNALMTFHAKHKYLLMSHNQVKNRELGKLISSHERWDSIEITIRKYEELLSDILRLKPTPKKHANALQHMMGYLKKLITADEKQELLEIIENYRQEQLPLIVPITLIAHYVRKYDVAYLKDQVYLNPHPIELKLRNHA